MAYTFNTYIPDTGVANHTFCKYCGVKPFYILRPNPGGLDINAQCFNGMPLEIGSVPFDGRNWQQYSESLVHKSRTS